MKIDKINVFNDGSELNKNDACTNALDDYSEAVCAVTDEVIEYNTITVCGKQYDVDFSHGSVVVWNKGTGCQSLLLGNQKEFTSAVKVLKGTASLQDTLNTTILYTFDSDKHVRVHAMSDSLKEVTIPKGKAYVECTIKGTIEKGLVNCGKVEQATNESTGDLHDIFVGAFEEIYKRRITKLSDLDTCVLSTMKLISYDVVAELCKYPHTTLEVENMSYLFCECGDMVVVLGSDGQDYAYVCARDKEDMMKEAFNAATLKFYSYCDF